MSAVCVCWWQTETIRDGDEEYTFSPYGIGQIDGWTLRSWTLEKTCDMGHKHRVKHWDSVMARYVKMKPPEVPKKVIAALKKKVKNAKPMPYPGGE